MRGNPGDGQRKMRRQKLGRRLLGLVLAFSSCIALLTTTAQLTVEYYQRKQEVVGSLDAVNLYLPSMSAAAWNLDDALIRTSVEALGHLPSVERVIVTLRNDPTQQWSSGSLRSRNIDRKTYVLQHGDVGKTIDVAD